MLKARHFIDSHKASNAPVILLLMWHGGAWENVTAWVYLALHGGYGLLWTLKSAVFGDRQWDQPIELVRGLVIWGGLSLYWVAPYRITTLGVTAANWLLALAIGMHALGVFLHFASDMQKHVALSLAPGRLVTTGLFRRTRNPNYLGELLIYGSFTVLALHWLPLAILGAIVLGLWVPNMRRKDRSLSRYPEFSSYRARTGLLFPRFW